MPELARQRRPDIAVLDLEMPPADGLQAASVIRAELPTKVVLVTRHARPGVLRRALHTGVSGFVPKTTPASKLAEILRGVAAGQRYVAPDNAASALTEKPVPSPRASSTCSKLLAPAPPSSRSPNMCTSPQELSATICLPRWPSSALRPATKPPTEHGKKDGSERPITAYPRRDRDRFDEHPPKLGNELWQV